MIRPDAADPMNDAIARLNARAWGIAGGLLFGFGLFAATIILVVKGATNPGAHLGLLSNYFPFYSVSIGGAIIGFVYAFVVGYAAGRFIGLVYNKLVGAYA
jgi:hypothetical protein